MAQAAPHAKTKQRLAELVQSWAEQPGFVAAVEQLFQRQPVVFSNVWGSSLAGMAAALHGYWQTHSLEQPLLIVCESDRQMDLVVQEAETFGLPRSSTVCFPAIEASNPDLILRDWGFGQRLRFIDELASGPAHNPLLLTSVGAIMQAIPSPAELAAARRVIQMDQEIDTQQFCQWLAEHGMHLVSAVQSPGEFSRRGGIIDVFPPNTAKPYRIELFDTVIDSIRQFEPTTQRSTDRLNQVSLLVASPQVQGDACLLDRLPAGTAILLIDPESADIEARRHQQLAKSSIAVLDWDQVRAKMGQHALGSIQESAFEVEQLRHRLPIQPLETFDGDLTELKSYIDRLAEAYEVLLVTPVEGELERLQEILSGTAAAARDRVRVLVGDFHAGFRDDHDKIAVVSCDQVFHRGELRRSRSRGTLGRALDSFLDLQDGDLVVHLAHGIGRFRGLSLLNKDNVEQEHLIIEFYGGTKIYVPATKMDLVQRYIGGSSRSPNLARVGSKSWQKQKAAAEEAIQDMASEMLQVQAQRSSLPGIRMGGDTHWQAEFEQSFPYTETSDQLHAITAIKDDMQSGQPMDRLLCGDVGFGKTEVAMRAAFKAVENGYQVGLMVPTTVLAEQHYQTLRRRMASFPLDIGKLSRFCSRKEQKETVAGLKSGRIDICVGTHRLASKDIQFHNLGLLIIDEEQKFGVQVKERLKAMRASVDVLTLSATPIPRTLHMSLVGVRNISNLETAPIDRLSVQTRLTRFDAKLFREAMLQELSRGGQAYFVHNRIADIYQWRDKLQSIVPEAKFAVGHGQMEEGELEKVMTDFVAGKFDVLIATTIVESGLDIPNANTIFIDEANRYGLADLHQLRGRVGRYKHKAYCYLLIDGKTRLKANASKRLQAIEHFSELGAGFSIAMRDLEIRGAGNLLGTEQSGHIAAIGYELYCQLLERAVRQLKKEPQPISIDVDIQLPGRGFLPDDYVADRRQKIDFYRRLTRIEKYDQIEEFKEELRDRFGKIPEPTEDLFQRVELKLDAAVWEITAIRAIGGFMVFDFANHARIEQLRSMKRSRLRITDNGQAFWPLDKDYQWTEQRLLKLAKKILHPEV